jgi:hypothetical protein
MWLMTAVDLPEPPLALTPPGSRPRVSVLSVVGFILGVLMMIDLLAVKTLVPIFDSRSFVHQIVVIANVFGVLNLLSLIPIGLGIVFGHVGVAETAKGRRGRALAVASLVLGYVLVALYVNRVLVSLIALSAFPGGGTFLQNNFFWA